jgi:hypothetical protein
MQNVGPSVSTRCIGAGQARGNEWRPDSPAVPANAVLFLASDEAYNIQVAEIVIDAGATGAPSGAPIYRKKEKATLSKGEKRRE